MKSRFGLLFSSILIFALILVSFPNVVSAQPSLGTGLKEPTSAQKAWINTNFPVIQKVNLNQIAIERINAERKAGGMVKLYTGTDFEMATQGQEVIISSSDLSNQTGINVASVLPGAVDNSLSPAFPPIRSQGSIGSCAAWATSYYQFTYETNLALGRTASGGDNSAIFSPKWTYNMINGGVDGGAYFSDAYNVEMKNGVASWADFPYDSNYLAWSLDPATWSKAIDYRPQTCGQFSYSDANTLITNLKAQLANGHIMVIGTYVNSWVKTTVKNDPSTTVDDPYVNQYIASYMKNTASGAHAMTLVGYNDNLWCDLNGNGIVNSGEKGAFKIANSWGTSDWNSGFRWVTYDSLRTTSAVSSSSSWPKTDRDSGGLLWNGSIFTLTVAPSSPTVLAEVTLNTANRSQAAVSLGLGSTSSTTPASTWTSKAVYYTGGSYAFNGTTTVCDGTFFFDFSDLAESATGAKRWFVKVADSASGSPLTLSSFKLYKDGVAVATSSNTPVSVDAKTAYVWLDYDLNSNNSPPDAIINATPVSGNMPLEVSFDGSGSTDPDSPISSYSWNFGDGSPAGSGATLNHTYTSAGIYTATLTVKDDKNISDSAKTTITVIDPNIPPVASINVSSTSGNLPLNVVFDGSSSSDADGTINSYSWNFGDGSAIASSISVNHTYTSAGQYTARLIVTDNKGATNTTSTKITVINPYILTAPSSLTASVKKTAITLNWKDRSNNETGFYVERGIKSRTTTRYTRIAQVSADVTTYCDKVAAAGTYYYRVQAFNQTSGSTSGYSNMVSAKVISQTLKTPSSLTSTVKYSGSNKIVTLKWKYTTGNEDGFYIERGTLVNRSYVYTRVGQVSAGKLTFNDTLTKSGTYYYRVQAFNLDTNKTSSFSRALKVNVK